MEKITEFSRWKQWEIDKKVKIREHAGSHILADFWGSRMVATDEELQMVLREAARIAGSTELGIMTHVFSPQGVTGIIMLSESHISLHTWPEKQYIAIDIFTCGEKSRPRDALRYLREYLAPVSVVAKEVRRGQK